MQSLEKISDATNEVNKVLIIGSGPTGLSAALYTARAELHPLLLTGMEIGGQAALTSVIENYPGFPEGISGLELGDLFRKQAENFGAQIIYDTITKVDLSSQPYKVSTYSKQYLTKSIIISTGASPNHLKVPGEDIFIGKGVSYCATCDGWFFKNKNVIVVGGGDSALEEAVFLTRFASSVTVVHRRDALRAGAILKRRAMENPKIKFIWDTVVKEISGNDSVEFVNLLNLKTNIQSNLATDGIFIFIGHTPNTAFFIDQLELDEQGYIITDKYCHTKVPGVFAAGEVTDSRYRQVVTSAGMGAAAAIEATHYLEQLEI